MGQRCLLKRDNKTTRLLDFKQSSIAHVMTRGRFIHLRTSHGADELFVDYTCIYFQRCRNPHDQLQTITARVWLFLFSTSSSFINDDMNISNDIISPVSIQVIRNEKEVDNEYPDLILKNPLPFMEYQLPHVPKGIGMAITRYYIGSSYFLQVGIREDSSRSMIIMYYSSVL